MPTWISRISRRSLLGALLLGFLLPFCTITCGGTKLATMSGVQTATGVEIKAPGGGRAKLERIQAEPLAGIALALGAVALVVAFLKGAPLRIASGAVSIASFLALIAMKLKMDHDATKQGEGMVQINWSALNNPIQDSGHCQ